jgi:flagellar hook-length control protein FliK
LNPALTTSLLKPLNSNEINAMQPIAEAFEATSDELFASEFSTAMQEMMSADGKFKPLSLAGLEGIDAQQLTELVEQNELTESGVQNGSQLPVELLSQPIDLKQHKPLNVPAPNAHSAIEDVNIVGNPEASTVLKTNIINDELSEEGLLNKQATKSDLFRSNVTIDDIQLTQVKKGPELTPVLSESDLDLSSHMKSLTKNHVDVPNDVLMHVGSQEINTTKLVDQLASLDKPLNTINAISNQPVKTYSNPEQSGVMLNRVEVPVQQAGWGEAVGNRLMMMVSGKMQSAHIQLNPAELGPIEVRINVNQDQASVHFVSSNTVVRDAIEEAFPRLKEMFMQNGLSLTDTNVSQQSSQQGNPYSREQNDSLIVSNNDVLDIADAETEQPLTETIDIGLVDQYV